MRKDTWIGVKEKLAVVWGWGKLVETVKSTNYTIRISLKDDEFL